MSPSPWAAATTRSTLWSCCSRPWAPCLTIGWATQAAKRGIDFRSLRIEVNGDYDLRGYLNLDDAVRPGFSRIGYTVHVDIDAPLEVLDEIRRAAERTSPMFDNVANGASITATLNHESRVAVR